MKKIWKYPIAIEDRQSIEIPAGFTILPTIQIVKGEVCIYAVVDPEEKEMDKLHLRLAGTGQNLLDTEVARAHYLGTFQLLGGSLVYHLAAIMPV